MARWLRSPCERAALRLTLCAALAAAAWPAGAQSHPASPWLPDLDTPVRRAAAPVPVRERLTRIDASTLVQLALLQNSDVQYARLQSEIAALGYEAETGLYKPTAYAALKRDGRSRQRTIEERITAALGGLTRLEELGKMAEAGVRMRTPSGAEASLALRSQTRRSNVIASAPFAPGDNEGVGSFVLAIKQPLLRGAGREVTETDLRVAEAEREIGRWQLRQQFLRVSSDALSAYWQWQRAAEAQALRSQALDNARAVVNDTRVRVAGGRLPIAALDEADATLAAREAEMARGAVALADAEARVRTLLDLPADDGGWRPAATELPPSDVLPPARDMASRLATAQGIWPPLRIAQLKRTQALDRMKLAEDRLRPQVDLQLSYSTNSLTTSGVSAAYRATQGNDPDWSVGVLFEAPLDGKDPRAIAQARAQALRIEQSELEIRAVRQALASDMVSRAQQLEASLREREQSQRDLEARLGLLEADELQYRNGTAPLSRMLRRQSDVLEARLRLVDAHARMELARVALQLTDGTLLASHRVQFEN